MPTSVSSEDRSEAVEVWGKISDRIKVELSEQSFKTWIAPLGCDFFDGSRLSLIVPDKFYGDWIHEHYESLIQTVAHDLFGFKPAVEYRIVEIAQPSHAARPPEQDVKIADDPNKKRVEGIELNPKNTFENFVIGSGNRFAHAAAFAVSEDLAKRYNPLFIYGGVGLGKTHLLQAIAFYALRKNRNMRVVYLSSERFTNQLIAAIQSRSTTSFRERYRAADLLLIDDIHFIAGKESTQEEFFHTFNTLYDSHKQIVVTSDRPPKDIPDLEERLVSRFGWGLVADIQAPDFETRVAILRKKMEKETVSVPNDVLYLIADKIKSNIRELEGALVRVIAYSSLTNTAMGTGLVHHVLRDSFTEEESKITIEHIQRCVADFFGVKISDLRAKRRTSSVVTPRQIAMHLTRELTKHSLPEIGDFFGGRGHATVLHAVNKIKGRVDSDPKTRKQVEELIGLIKK